MQPVDLLPNYFDPKKQDSGSRKFSEVEANATPSTASHGFIALFDAVKRRSAHIPGKPAIEIPIQHLGVCTMKDGKHRVFIGLDELAALVQDVLGPT